ncbi:MAG: hypothetical protein ACKOWF_01485, partial [Chloroflexota bacterium]
MASRGAVGQRVRRLDSPPKLTGQERFTGDLRIPGLLHCRPVGSAHAHARIAGIDGSAALRIPGVVAVLTADDLPLSRDADGNPARTPLAYGEALWAGQPVALVLAETEAAPSPSAGTPAPSTTASANASASAIASGSGSASGTACARG